MVRYYKMEKLPISCFGRVSSKDTIPEGRRLTRVLGFYMDMFTGDLFRGQQYISKITRKPTGRSTTFFTFIGRKI